MILNNLDQPILVFVEAAEDTRNGNLIGNYIVKDMIVNAIETEITAEV